ncbi:MAG: hypothetical protein R3E01_11585 [Pirellulaceae bacterium]|nr:hypothetical protein [Planctomycetales bacterium]
MNRNYDETIRDILDRAGPDPVEVHVASGSPLIPSTFLFQFEVPCRYLSAEALKVLLNGSVELGDDYRLPTFGELDGKTPYADVRMGWHETGMVISLSVRGKKQPPWCRATRSDESDGISVFFDTRNVKNSHRASRFCHRFLLLPQGGGSRLTDPLGIMLPIDRAKELPRPVGPEMLMVRAESRIDGYLLRAFIPAKALTGFDTREHRAIGFSYQVFDRELGFQTMAVDPMFPMKNDPSCWETIRLID